MPRDLFAQPAQQPRPPFGPIVPGNIDLNARPVVPNGDGYSTVRTIGVGSGQERRPPMLMDGRETNLPTVSDDGRLLSNQDAISSYQQTGKHLGQFGTPLAAEAFAQNLHQQQAQQYQPRDLFAAQPPAPSTDVPQLPAQYHAYQSLMKSPAEVASMGHSRDNIMALPFAMIPGGKAIQTAAGAVTGAITAANEAPEGESKILPALGGAALGGATALGVSALAPKLYQAGKAIAGKLGGAPAPAVAPTSDELRAGAKAAYQKASDAGVIISKPSWTNAVADIKQTLIDEGLHPALHPKVTAVLGDLEQANDNLTLDGADRLRRIVAAAGKSIEPDERRLAQIAKGKLDDYLTSLSEKDVLGGDPQAATSALKDARDLWSRMSKGDFVDDLVDRAGTRAGQFTGSGFENALRTEFRGVALNAKKMRRFTPDEQDAIKKVAEGGPIGNAMRWLGKFAPRGVVSTAAGQAIGNTVAGPIGGYAMPALGELGRLGATAATSRNASVASELMRSGGVAPVADPQSAAVAKLLESAPAPGLSSLALSRLLAQPVNNSR